MKSMLHQNGFMLKRLIEITQTLYSLCLYLTLTIMPTDMLCLMTKINAILHLL